MHAWEAIQKTLELIEDSITEEIPIEELAENAALSVFYYQRLFSRLVKKPVREYIKMRRLARACDALRDKSKRILDVALEYGFGSHEVFSKAFKEAYAMTPTEYRESKVNLNNFEKPDLMLSYTLVDIGIPLINDGLVLEINRRTLDEPVTFIGVDGHVSIDGIVPHGIATGVDEPGEVWRQFFEVMDKIPGIIQGRRIGVAYHGNAPNGCFTYFAGAETDLCEGEGFKTWTLPAGEYIVCRFEAETFDEMVSTALYKVFNYMHMWQEKNGLKRESFGAEIYYDQDEEKQGYVYMETWVLWLE